MHGKMTVRWNLITAVLLASSLPAQAGQTPGVATPWNGPWGGGYLNGGPYSPLASPYVSAGYPLALPYGYSTGPAAQTAPGAQQQQLPGGGYLLPPGPGGGILPGAYAR